MRHHGNRGKEWRSLVSIHIQMKNTIILSKEDYESLLKEANKPRPPSLLYQGISKWENLEAMQGLSKQQITIMFDTLENSSDYPKHIHGAFTRQRDVTILALLTFLGLRPGEACSLKFTDVNLQTMIVSIRPETNKQKKGRLVPIPKQVLIYFRKYFAYPRHLWKGSEFIFPSMESPHISSERWKGIMREKILKPCGLWVMPKQEGDKRNNIPKFRSYSLRHSFANDMLSKSKMDINAVANLLGHASLDSTKRYLHQNKDYQDYLRQIMEKK